MNHAKQGEFNSITNTLQIPSEDQDKNLIEEVLTAKIKDEFHTLKEAKESPDWPEWENIIQTKLN